MAELLPFVSVAHASCLELSTPAPLTCTTARASTYLQPHRHRHQGHEPIHKHQSLAGAPKLARAGLGRTFRGEGLQVEDRLLALADAVLVERRLLADVHHQRLVGLRLRNTAGASV